jgi:hypothetical protein
MPHNFQIFDQNQVDILNDGDYASSAQRLNGFSGVAQETLANKCLYQLSVMCKALAQVLSDAGETVSDATFTALVISIKNIFQTRFFESTQQTITAGGSLTIPHGLGVAPKQINCFLVCQTSENGYTAGDVLAITNFAYFITAGGTAYSQGQSIKVDSTNITVRFATGGGGTTVYSSIDGSTGDPVNLTDANWKLLIRARG